jgi:transcription-repair coupling factor (superfamily II helicase)
MLYQRISACDDHQSLHELQLEVIDRFGLIPGEGSMVFRLATLQLNGAAHGVRVIQAGKTRGRVAFLQTTSVNPKRIAHLLTRHAGVFSMISPLELGFTMALNQPEHRVVFCEWLTGMLDSAQPFKPLPLFS